MSNTTEPIDEDFNDYHPLVGRVLLPPRQPWDQITTYKQLDGALVHNERKIVGYLKSIDTFMTWNQFNEKLKLPNNNNTVDGYIIAEPRQLHTFDIGQRVNVNKAGGKCFAKIIGGARAENFNVYYVVELEITQAVLLFRADELSPAA